MSMLLDNSFVQQGGYPVISPIYFITGNILLLGVHFTSLTLSQTKSYPVEDVDWGIPDG